MRASSSASASAASSGAVAPILFLDLDGVLNRTATAPQINLEQDKVNRLRDVLADTNAEVVLSTYWRCFEDYVAYALGRMGAQGERVVGRTPGEPHLMDSVAHDANVSSSRIEEVRSYLSTRFGEDEAAWPRFAIVDDKQVVPEDGHAWSDRFVKTTHDAGLTDERAEALRAALRAPATVVSR
jgi:hypothetical protein